MDSNELKVRDITLREQPVFNRSGEVTTKTVVTFWVGGHGPFTREYDGKAIPAAQITTDIEAQVLALRTLLTS